MLTDGSGHLIVTDPFKPTMEADIGTCPHCQKVINLQEWREARGLGENGWCRQCRKPLCPSCTERMLTEGCVPFVKWVEDFLSDQHRRSQFRKLTGLE